MWHKQRVAFLCPELMLVIGWLMQGHKLELLSANETAAHGEEKRAVFSSPHSCPKGEHEVVRKGLKMRIS